MSIIIDQRADMEIDLEGDNSRYKKMKFIVKEGVKYKLQLLFNVQREIASGLIFSNRIYHHGISTDKDRYIVGSYAPREEMHKYQSPEMEFPSGLLSRGEYEVKNVFTDDDKNEILAWEWIFEIKEDWED